MRVQRVHRHNSRNQPHAFTLVEILIVVIILGILAAIVVPQFSNASTESRNKMFTTNVRSFAQLFLVEIERNGEFPADTSPGEIPAGMESLLEPTTWDVSTPLGGQWDWDYDVFGVTAAISVEAPDRTASEMAAVDALLDDGDVATGHFRARAGGYMYVLIP